MSNRYSRVFNNPYPSGWKNLPSVETPIIAQALQQHTNAIINIEQFLDGNPIPTYLSELTDDGVIPTKVSDLINDSQFITRSDMPRIPTKTSQLQNDRHYITNSDIPTNLSAFFNDMNYITNSINNLINYYNKDQTYNKEEVTELIDNIPNLSLKVVDELPTSNISMSTIYLVPKSQRDNIVMVDTYVLNIFDGEIRNDSNVLSIGDIVTTEEVIEEVI